MFLEKISEKWTLICNVFVANECFIAKNHINLVRLKKYAFMERISIQAKQTLNVVPFSSVTKKSCQSLTFSSAARIM